MNLLLSKMSQFLFWTISTNPKFQFLKKPTFLMFSLFQVWLNPYSKVKIKKIITLTSTKTNPGKYSHFKHIYKHLQPSKLHFKTITREFLGPAKWRTFFQVAQHLKTALTFWAWLLSFWRGAPIFFLSTPVSSDYSSGSTMIQLPYKVSTWGPLRVCICAFRAS